MNIGSTPCDEQALRRTAIATPKASQPATPATNPGVLAGFSVRRRALSSFAPVFLRLAPHRWRNWVLELKPVRRTAGAVARAEPLGDDALAAELAGVLDHRAIIWQCNSHLGG